MDEPCPFIAMMDKVVCALSAELLRDRWASDECLGLSYLVAIAVA